MYLFCATGRYRLWIFGGCRMAQFSIAIALVGCIWLSVAHSTANAAPCLVVTLTGTHGRPASLQRAGWGRNASELRR